MYTHYPIDMNDSRIIGFGFGLFPFLGGLALGAVLSGGFGGEFGGYGGYGGYGGGYGYPYSPYPYYQQPYYGYPSY